MATHFEEGREMATNGNKEAAINEFEKAVTAFKPSRTNVVAMVEALEDQVTKYEEEHQRLIAGIRDDLVEIRGLLSTAAGAMAQAVHALVKETQSQP
jgi:hypothetical protein